jgi:hypothetical protein
MRSGYYDWKLDNYNIGTTEKILRMDHCALLDCVGHLEISARYEISYMVYTMDIHVSPGGNSLHIRWNDGSYGLHDQDIIQPSCVLTALPSETILKSSYCDFLYSNIERILNDGSELELCRFTYTEFVKFAEYYNNHFDMTDYVFGQLPTKK